MSDPVNPAHYRGDYVMRIIEDFGLDFLDGQVVKYILRSGNKPGEPAARDYEKALWYLQRKIGKVKNTPPELADPEADKRDAQVERYWMESEREACARIADATLLEAVHLPGMKCSACSRAQLIASRIRARSSQGSRVPEPESATSTSPKEGGK